MSAEDNKHTAEVLNDLLKINNDRVEGYKKALDETKEVDLKDLFLKMQHQSEKIAMTLTTQIARFGETPEVGSTTNSGKIYRAWMDVKASFSGNDRESVLKACHFGEDAAQTAYDEALQDEELPVKINILIKEQQVELKMSHDTIKELRDLAVPI